MIRGLYVSNYRSLGEDVRLEFTDANPRLLVLTGVNDSGKSNALDAFRFIGDVLRDGLDPAVRLRGGLGGILRDASPRLHLAVELEVDDGRWFWGLGLEETDERGGSGYDWAYFV